jgi:Zn finger protein HypA/HybF involved in hydrogenase expression
MTSENRMYLAAISVGRLEILLENARAELCLATRAFAEEPVRWECIDCGLTLSRGEVVGVPPHCNRCGKRNVRRMEAP